MSTLIIIVIVWVWECNTYSFTLNALITLTGERKNKFLEPLSAAANKSCKLFFDLCVPVATSKVIWRQDDDIIPHLLLHTSVRPLLNFFYWGNLFFSCKPLNDREHSFYRTLPRILQPYTPKFEGVMSVAMHEDENGYITLMGAPPNCYGLKQNRYTRPHFVC